MCGRIMLLFVILSYMLFFLIMADETVEVVKTVASNEGKEVIKEGKTRKARDIVIPGEYHETSLEEDVPEEYLEEFLARLRSLVDSLDLPQEDTETADEDLFDVDLTELSAVLEQQDSSTSADSEGITTLSPSEPGDGYAPCEPPFEEIAYHMCILQEVTLRLSWGAAQLYCQERGAELAMDPVVVKARRYLNNLYGEDGSRVRWPMWIGGKRVEDGSWRWQDGSKVVGFLWSQGQPRYYAQSLIPHGTCMILDGYQSYNGAALPCHLRRRFVCQRSN